MVESDCKVGDPSSIPELGRSPGEGKGYPLQYSGLENSMDCIVHGVAELDTTERLSLFTFPGGTVDKNLPANVRDTGLIPGPERFHVPRSN